MLRSTYERALEKPMNNIILSHSILPYVWVPATPPSGDPDLGLWLEVRIADAYDESITRTRLR